MGKYSKRNQQRGGATIPGFGGHIPMTRYTEDEIKVLTDAVTAEFDAEKKAVAQAALDKAIEYNTANPEPAATPAAAPLASPLKGGRRRKSSAKRNRKSKKNKSNKKSKKSRK